MSEKRPSKKQQELFVFIDNFIKSTGYGPSYREVMRALDYRSVSTVATHIDGLIAKGLLRKKDNSARSLEVVVKEKPIASSDKLHIDWLKKQIKKQRDMDTRQSNEHAKKLEAALVILQIDMSEHTP